MASFESTVLILNPRGQLTATLGMFGVAPDAGRPHGTAHPTQVFFGLVKHLGIGMQMDHDVAQQCAQPPPVSVSGRAPVGASLFSH